MPQAPDHKLDEFIAGAQNARDMDELKEQLTLSLSDLGFDWFMYIGMNRSLVAAAPSSESMGVPSIAINVVPPEWADRYAEQEYWGDDPTVPATLRTIIPFRWDDLLEGDPLPLRGSQVMQEAVECGLHSGLTVPVLDHGGKIGWLSVASQEPRAELGDPRSNLVHAVHLRSIYFHAALQAHVVKAKEPPQEQRLRPREIECLQWTARGKTAWEISMILKVSERTVNFHIGNAMRKLGVYNKTHAVAKMLVTGLADL